jgi:hypothetical protein
MLAPNEWFNDILVDAVPGLMAATVDTRTFVLSSLLYAGHTRMVTSEEQTIGSKRYLGIVPDGRSAFAKRHIGWL